MPSIEPALTVKSLVEVAWLLSRVGRQMIEFQTEPPATALRSFWQSTRQLQRSWDLYLQNETFQSSESDDRFADLAARSLTTEMLARVWATILGRIDQRTGRQDLTRIAANSVNGLLQIRHRLQSCLLNQCNGTRAADLDRLRRRCDRWTDLLIGNICGNDEFFDFAYNPERARDFAEESRDSMRSTRPVELLVTAGVRLSFLGQLPDVILNDPAFETLMQSVLGSIPAQAFDSNGLLRSKLNQPLPPLDRESAQDVVLPGMSLDRLRERFC